MRSHLLKRAAVTAVGATMLIAVGAACGGDTAGRLVTAGPPEEEPAECLQGVPDTLIGETCLGMLNATMGPVSPTPATPVTPACYPPVLDPVARQYIEAGIVELPGAVMGPARPTCGPDDPAVGEPAETTVAEPDRPTVVPPAGPTGVEPVGVPALPL